MARGGRRPRRRRHAAAGGNGGSGGDGGGGGGASPHSQHGAHGGTSTARKPKKAPIAARAASLAGRLHCDGLGNHEEQSTSGRLSPVTAAGRGEWPSARPDASSSCGGGGGASPTKTSRSHSQRPGSDEGGSLGGSSHSNAAIIDFTQLRHARPNTLGNSPPFDDARAPHERSAPRQPSHRARVKLAQRPPTSAGVTVSGTPGNSLEKLRVPARPRRAQPAAPAADGGGRAAALRAQPAPPKHDRRRAQLARLPTATPQWRRSTAAAHAASDGVPGAGGGVPGPATAAAAASASAAASAASAAASAASPSRMATAKSSR